MKIRAGFVSNSSSSSFVVYKDAPEISAQERLEINSKKLSDAYGEDYLIDCPSALSKIPENAVLIGSYEVAYGAEEHVEFIVKDICKVLAPTVKIWGEFKDL